MNKYLINEAPLTFQPTLAVFLGLNEAIILQQVQYWLSNPKCGIEKAGFKWVYNSYEKWQEENFPFWSVDGLKKMFLRLEDLGVLVSKQLSDNKWDKTKYYRIDYERLDEVLNPYTEGSATPIEKDAEAQSTITETNTESLAIAGNPALPLSIENQIYLGRERIDTRDEKQAMYMDAANLIATGFGANYHLAYGLAYVFMDTRGIGIPMSKIKSQRKAVKDMIEMGVLPNHVMNATRKLLEDNITVVDLYSVAKTAIALANPAPEDNESHIEGV